MRKISGKTKTRPDATSPGPSNANGKHGKPVRARRKTSGGALCPDASHRSVGWRSHGVAIAQSAIIGRQLESLYRRHTPPTFTSHRRLTIVVSTPQAVTSLPTNTVVLGATVGEIASHGMSASDPRLAYLNESAGKLDGAFARFFDAFLGLRSRRLLLVLTGYSSAHASMKPSCCHHEQAPLPRSTSSNSPIGDPDSLSNFDLSGEWKCKYRWSMKGGEDRRTSAIHLHACLLVPTEAEESERVIGL